MKPIKLKNMKRTNCWKPTGPVWYQHNDDGQWLKTQQQVLERLNKEEVERVERRKKEEDII